METLDAHGLRGASEHTPLQVVFGEGLAPSQTADESNAAFAAQEAAVLGAAQHSVHVSIQDVVAAAAGKRQPGGVSLSSGSVDKGKAAGKAAASTGQSHMSMTF